MASPPSESGLVDSDENITSNSTASELTRIFNSAGVIPGPGGWRSFSSGEDDRDEERAGGGLEEGADDFVAVDHDDAPDYSYLFRRSSQAKQRTALDNLYPFTSVLTVGNVDDCVSVEEVFPEEERASKEKVRPLKIYLRLCYLVVFFGQILILCYVHVGQFVYRLTKCPELCLGLFSLPLLDEGESKPRPELIAHIVATRTSAPRVTEESMMIPEDWSKQKGNKAGNKGQESIGHDDHGSTIALHSLAVKAEHQGKRVGSTLIKSYIQRMKDAAVADRIALLAHQHMVSFYERLGFYNCGLSECTFGGGGWFDMVRWFPR